MSAVGKLNAGAGSALDEFPCIALEVGGRGALAGRAGPRRTIVLALQRNAEALFFMSRDGRVSPSAFVSGAAAAIVVSAVVRAPARTSELTTFLADIVSSKLGLRRPLGGEHRSIRLFAGGYYRSGGSQIREAAGYASNLSVRRPRDIVSGVAG